MMYTRQSVTLSPQFIAAVNVKIQSVKIYRKTALLSGLIYDKHKYTSLIVDFCNLTMFTEFLVFIGTIH